MINLQLPLYAAALSLALGGCEKNGETSLQRTNRLLKSVTWRLDKLTINQTNEPLLYAGMTLMFSKDIYISENAEQIWSLLGLWQLKNETTLVRDDGLIVNIQSIDQSRLILTLKWNKATYCSTAQPKSNSYVFELIPIEIKL